MMSVTTNTAALTAQRYVHDSSTAASSSIAKMSSGSRIVKPSDDAASLAISNKLSATIGGLEQASRNAAQGASLLQVASGALDEIGSMLSRMKVLASQVNNGALSSTERLFAQEEFNNLRTQITNTATQTRWNDQSLLTGGAGGVTPRGGATVANQQNPATANTLDTTISTTGIVHGAASLATVNAGAAGDYSVEVKIGDQTFKGSGILVNDGGQFTLTSTTNATNSVTFSFDATSSGITNATTFQTALQELLDVDAGGAAADFSIGAVTAGASGLVANGLFDGSTFSGTGFFEGTASAATVTANGSKYDVSVTIGKQTFKGTVAAPTAGGTMTLTSTTDGANAITLTYAGTLTTDVNPATFQNALRETLGVGTSSAARFVSASVAQSAYNGVVGIDPGKTAAAGGYALNYEADTNTFKLTDGANVYAASVTENGEQTVTFGNGVSVNLGSSFALGTDISQVTFAITDGDHVAMDFQVAEQAGDVVRVEFVAATSTALGLDELSLASVEDAATAITAIDTAVNAVNVAQANIGAVMSRFEYIQSTIATQVENLTAARGTFRDVDMAKEMTEFTKNQTLMQAGISMLGQANQMPQLMLRLIQ